MEFLKKNYEKVLLGLVLFGLVVAVALLPLKISSERQALEEIRNTLIVRQPKELEPLNLAKEKVVLDHLEGRVKLDYSSPHNIFNPVPWQKAADGSLIKVATGREVGPAAVDIVEITPLHLVLSFDSASGSGYLIGVERQAAATLSQRRKRQTYSTLNSKNEFFTLREIKGSPESPTELVIELAETGERVSIGPDSPYKRKEGYAADLRYAPEKKTWKDQRVGSTLVFAGEAYNIVAITENDVVLSAKSNNKKTTIKYNTASATR